MINYISSWAKQIIIAIIISSIIEMILPNGNNSKYIKMILGIFILFTIISPCINTTYLNKLDINNIEKKIYDYTENGFNDNALNQTSMDERLEELYIEEMKKDIKQNLNKEGYEVISCKVDAVLFNDEKKGINNISVVISQNDNEKKEDSKSNIGSIEKININVGLERFLNSEKNEETATSEKIEKVKDIISNSYEIEKNLINVVIK